MLQEEAMSKEESNAISNYDEIKALKKKYLTARRELKQVRSRAKRRELKEYIDDLKIELGWTLLDCK
jgi:DNA-binding protein H-NS